MKSICNYLITNYQWLIGVTLDIVLVIFAYHLSKRLSGKAKLEHREQIKAKTDDLLRRIRKEKLRSKIYHVNINRYFKDYPSNIEKINGYSIIAGEIKTTRFDGVEFFCSMFRSVYKRSDGKLTFKDLGKDKKVFSVIPVGLVPYEWIVHVDLDGDEFDYRPLFYSDFKGPVFWKGWRRLIPYGYPYKKIFYYRRSEHFKDGESHPDLEWVLVENINKN